jgi:hypothetical protein
MIICHRQWISDHDIRAAIDGMRTSDPQVLITPGKIYRAPGKGAGRGGCLPPFLDTMRQSPAIRIPTPLELVRKAG